MDSPGWIHSRSVSGTGVDLDYGSVVNLAPDEEITVLRHSGEHCEICGQIFYDPSSTICNDCIAPDILHEMDRYDF